MLGREDLEKMARSSEKMARSKEKMARSSVKMARPSEKMARPSAQEGVNAVLLQDLLSSILSPTVVLKMDIEGYECKVTFLFCTNSFWRN